MLKSGVNSVLEMIADSKKYKAQRWTSMVKDKIRLIPFEEKYRDDLIYMILDAENALGRVRY